MPALVVSDGSKLKAIYYLFINKSFDNKKINYWKQNGQENNDERDRQLLETAHV
jgi:hypothetical protein